MAAAREAPDLTVRVPSLTVTPPVKVLVPPRSQVPVPVLARAVRLTPELSTMAPLRVLAAVEVPVSVRVLLPAPVAVRAAVRVRAPAPEASRVAPPVVPARLTTRLELWPEPV